jgi:small ligand-binding sensory domain FIST
MSAPSTTAWAAAFAEGDPSTLAARCLAQLPDTQGATTRGATLGILYVSEPTALVLPLIARELAAGTGISSWVGGVGLGVSAPGHEVYENHAAVVMTLPLPPDRFRLFGATDDPAADLPRHHASWIEAVSPSLALVHGDPRCENLLRATVDAAAASGAFLVGGLVSHRCAEPLLAGEVAGPQGVASALGKAGIAGLLLAPEIAVATGLTQGCTPIGPVHRIDEARDNVIMAIDGRPALAVFYEDIGPALAKDPRNLGGLIFAGLPVAGSDTGDYLVRNLMAIDPRQGWVVLGAEVAPGDQILFCRRDPESARTDMSRMLRQLGGRLPGPPKAGVYVSCIGRGAALFGEPGVETAMIRETLGDFPLIGFFANGEISRDRLYGHTGVLTLFT